MSTRKQFRKNVKRLSGQATRMRAAKREKSTCEVDLNDGSFTVDVADVFQQRKLRKRTRPIAINDIHYQDLIGFYGNTQKRGNLIGQYYLSDHVEEKYIDGI